MRWEFQIGLRYLRARRRQFFGSLIAVTACLGVAIGVMTLTIVLSVMTGFEEDLRDRILGFTPQIIVLSHAGAIRDYAPDVDRVRSTPGVVAAAPFIYTQVMLTTATSVAGASVRGVEPDHLNDVIDVKKHLKEGSADELGRPMPVKTIVDGEDQQVMLDQVMLGFELARLLGVRVGDPVNVISPLGSPGPFGMVPRVKRFAVGGIFDSGMYELDSTIIFMSLADAQQFLEIGPAITGIEVKVKDQYESQAIARRIEGVLGFPFHARDWLETNRNLFIAFSLEKAVYFIVLLLIVLVAAFNIVATLIMVVMEKRKDIAILKSMGATNLAVGTIFVFKGAVIGTVGTVLGVLGGLGGSALLSRYHFIELPKDVFYVSTVPVRIYPENFIAVALASLLICVFATIYPARQAARLSPVEVIRYE